MFRLALALNAALLLGSCALFEPRPAPLTKDEVVRMAKDGASVKQIIEKLKATDTVILLSASEIVRLHDQGVPDEVLDYMQRTQIDELRWRERFGYMYGYGPYGRAMPCYGAPLRYGWYSGWPGCY